MILCHLFMVNIAKFISKSVHKEIILFIHKKVVDSHVLFHQYLLILIIFPTHANKKALSIQSTLQTSVNCLIFYTSPVSFVGLETV